MIGGSVSTTGLAGSSVGKGLSTAMPSELALGAEEAPMEAVHPIADKARHSTTNTRMPNWDLAADVMAYSQRVMVVEPVQVGVLRKLLSWHDTIRV